MLSLGYALVYLGWGAGVPLIVYGVGTNWRVWGPKYRRIVVAPDDRSRAERYSRPLWLAIMVLACVVVVSTELPWVRGPGLDGAVIELDAWSGLDLFSAGFVYAGSFFLVLFARTSAIIERAPWLTSESIDEVARRSALTVVVLSLALLAVIGGNVMIQLATPTGSRVAAGAWVATAASAIAAILAVLQWLGALRPEPPLRSAP